MALRESRARDGLAEIHSPTADGDRPRAQQRKTKSQPGKHPLPNPYTCLPHPLMVAVRKHLAQRPRKTSHPIRMAASPFPEYCPCANTLNEAVQKAPPLKTSTRFRRVAQGWPAPHSRGPTWVTNLKSPTIRSRSEAPVRRSCERRRKPKRASPQPLHNPYRTQTNRETTTSLTLLAKQLNLGTAGSPPNLPRREETN
ncbi:MAG: hypothetical protein JWR26_4035 [Pedosphaera sp.]|nr:hypothetical protein [Pedosphaera sp.]